MFGALKYIYAKLLNNAKNISLNINNSFGGELIDQISVRSNIGGSTLKIKIFKKNNTFIYRAEIIVGDAVVFYSFDETEASRLRKFLGKYDI